MACTGRRTRTRDSGDRPLTSGSCLRDLDRTCLHNAALADDAPEYDDEQRRREREGRAKISKGQNLWNEFQHHFASLSPDIRF